MEGYLRLIKKIARKRRELDLLLERLKTVCPHRQIEEDSYVEDYGTQERTRMVVFRCAACGRYARMTGEEYAASGGNPFKTPG
ncbi:MAG: hypothetical protein ACOX8O_08735 [Christensenellales bacterium]|jgi:hypothetical protein